MKDEVSPSAVPDAEEEPIKEELMEESDVEKEPIKESAEITEAEQEEEYIKEEVDDVEIAYEEVADEENLEDVVDTEKQVDEAEQEDEYITEEVNDVENVYEEVADEENLEGLVNTEGKGDEAEKELSMEELSDKGDGNEALMDKVITKGEVESEEKGGDEDNRLLEEEKNKDDVNKEGPEEQVKNNTLLKAKSKRKLVKPRNTICKKKKTKRAKKGVIASKQENTSGELTNDENVREKVNSGNQGGEEEKENATEEFQNEENAREADMNGEMKIEEQVKSVSRDKVGMSKKRGRRGEKKRLRGVNEKNTKIKNDIEPSNKKTKKNAKSMGMIFMCSSKTKNDCYRFKVLGLPSSKRDIVLEIYEGMKLFLFDFDLKLMYGIYEAAGPGGYNIEPKAFKSAFPSQVRFNVWEDCKPLPEEKFKNVIKDNYYTKNKFDCQLTSEQVNDLCNLFLASSSGSELKRPRRSPGPEKRALDRDKGNRTKKRGVRAEPYNEDMSRKRLRREIEREPAPQREKQRKPAPQREKQREPAPRREKERKPVPPREKERKPPPRRDQLHNRHARAPRVAPPPLSLPYPPSSVTVPSRTYAYEGTLGMSSGRSPGEHWNRQFLDLDSRHQDQGLRRRDTYHHDGQFIDTEFRRRDDFRHPDPYDMYRDRPSYHDPSYSASQQSIYNRPTLSALHSSAVQTEYSRFNRYNRSWY